MRIVSGIQPSGRLHLGNYFGAVRQFVELAEGDDRPLYFIADLHALTTVHDGGVLERNRRNLALDLLALGLGPERCVLFEQSAVPEVVELAWVLGTVTPLALLRRGHSYKDKVDQGLSPSVGLFTYPVLMAADVLVYDAERVPVGRDQLQHLEFARDMATKLNLAYVPGWDPASPDAARSGLVRLPEALVRDEAAVVSGTDGRKMSKSYRNTIDVFAPDDELTRRVMTLKTDSTPVEAPKPAGTALQSLLSLVCPPGEMAEHARTWREGGVGYGEYKRRLLECLRAQFGEARRRRADLERDEAYVARVLSEGAAEARELARGVWERVAAAVGVTRRLTSSG